MSLKVIVSPLRVETTQDGVPGESTVVSPPASRCQIQDTTEKKVDKLRGALNVKDGRVLSTRTQFAGYALT